MSARRAQGNPIFAPLLQTNTLCAPAPRKGKCREKVLQVIALNTYEGKEPYAIAGERKARVGGKEEKRPVSNMQVQKLLDTSPGVKM